MMEAFYIEFLTLVRAADRGSYVFMNPDGSYRGFVQLLWGRGRRITIHRLWSLQHGKGHGSMMLGSLCDLADRHGVEIVLKALPIGRKPYPMSRDQLFEWYRRHGFEGTRRKMIRKPKIVK